MTVTQITTHEDDAVGRFLEQLKEQDGWEGLVRAFVSGLQDLEDTLFDMILSRALQNAVGEQLDNWGVLLGVTRDGRNDADYKSALILQVGRNVGEGQPESIIALVLALSDPDLVVFTEPSYGWLRLDLQNPTIPVSGAEFYKAINTAVAGGVGLIMVQSATQNEDPTPTEPKAFRYTSITPGLSTIPAPSNAGYGSVNFPGEGGGYSVLIGP